ncbi:OmpA family protein [Desulfobacterales bacterium HSG17]|nr:OmpA family protein [Desulfobacterales bacterium HSG17]
MKFFTRSLVVLFAFLFLFGCASKSIMPTFDTKTFDKNMYTSKVDNFIVLFDASSSMNHNFNESSKFDIARALVYGMNDTIPELGQTAGLRSFGHAPDVSKEKTVLFYGMEKYSTQQLANNFTQVTKAGGFSPLYLALDEAGNDLDGLSGDMNAVIIISDGLDLPGDVLASAKKLKERYGETICFYPILVGNAKEGEALLQEIADIGGCGFFSTADEMLSYGGMADFVEMVFLGDRIAAPAGVKVTPKGNWVIENVLFDFDKSIIKNSGYPILNNVVNVLKKNPGIKVVINGHCDNKGTSEYNMGLSKRRSNAVKAYLVSKGISGSRLTTQGFGFTKPVALNGTAGGRAINRRVEFDLD